MSAIDYLKKHTEEYGIDLNDDLANKLEIYARHLKEWNEKINLTAITDDEGIAVKHFLDCLLVCKYADFKSGDKIIDVGTGAGFPGLVIAAANPDVQVTLLDSTGKKLKAVADMAQAMGVNNAQVVHMRAEEAGIKVQLRNRFDFSFSRAVANLRDLSEYCLPLTKVGGTFVALKGAKAQEEIDEAKEAIKILGGEIADVKQIFLSDMGERNIVVIKKVSPTPPKYPRASAKIAKEPLGMPKK